MAVNTKHKELLLRSLDEQLEPEEAVALETALEQSAELREEKRQLMAMRTMLGGMKNIPAPGITDGVVQRIKRPALERSIARLLPQVAAACVLLVIAGLLAIYFTEGSLTAEAILGVSELAPEEAYSYLNN